MKKRSMKRILSIFILVSGIPHGSLFSHARIFSDQVIASTIECSTKTITSDTLDKSTGGDYYKSIHPEKLISVNPANVEEIRSLAVSIIFGQNDLPEQRPDTVFRVTDTVYGDIELAKIEQFEISQPHNINSTGYIFHPVNKNNKLVLYHQGHNGDFLYGKSTIKYFTERGYTVYAFCMPLLGKNKNPYIPHEKLGVIHMNGNHDYFKFLDNPIGYFINPVVVMLNYAEKLDFDHITMVGISGGGWTTTLAAAVDTRIEYSFPVAGTYPIYLRFTKPEKDWGDFEQTWPDLYEAVNYLDFYIMGSTGISRKQVQVINQYDSCCFDGLVSGHYEPSVQKAIMEFGEGSFKVIIDSTHKEHKISKFALQKILEEMNDE